MNSDIFNKNIGDNYIKKIKIKKGKIFVYNYKEFFKTKKYVLDNSKNNIQNLLEKHEAQVKDYDELINVCNSRSSILDLASLTVLLPAFVPTTDPLLKLSLLVPYVLCKYIKYNHLIISDDLNKKQLFYKYKDTINEALKVSNIVLDKNIIIKQGTNLDINNVDKYSYQEIAQIIATAVVENAIYKNSKEKIQSNQKTLK